MMVMSKHYVSEISTAYFPVMNHDCIYAEITPELCQTQTPPGWHGSHYDSRQLKRIR